jgi:hypothetical protein
MVMRCGALSLFLSLQKSMNVKGFLLPKLSCSPPRFSQSPTRAFNAAQSQSISSSPIVVQEAPLHFFNNAGASPSPPKVLETILAHLDLEVKEGGYGAAKIVQEDGRLDHVYDAVIKLINAASPMEVALVESATVAWTRAFYSMVDYILELELELEQRRGDTDININTNMNANILPPLEKVILVSEAEMQQILLQSSSFAVIKIGGMGHSFVGRFMLNNFVQCWRVKWIFLVYKR